MIDDLKETFDNLRVYKMMLNPAKCVFGVPAGKLLGFLVSNRGIEANPVLVLKKNGTWRTCVDYTDLNKACPADPFALPRIDQIIDATAGCERLSFLDAYSGYHHIKMAVKDQEKTTFITPFGAFYYVSMPFGLKSAQATYQRCVQNCLHKQIGRNFMHMWMIL